ncbi:MAG TPA: amidohydrolase family protein [Gammaproteobacteria bacterium]|nr:amidohydrolase family protein [Gammaproteobacteria bacterium]
MARAWRLLAGLAVLLAAGPAAAEPVPFADVHLHFNWDHEELIQPAEAVRRLRAENVVLGVVSGVPAERALKLRRAGGDWIIPLFSPYIHFRGRTDWFTDPRVVEQARAGLASGAYFGIGEVHFIAGVGPRWDNEVFQGLLDLARKFEVPVLIHTESSSHEYFEPVCKGNPGIRFQWAHAGARLGPDEVGALMAACPNVWTEFSARDPGRYGKFADPDGHLDPAWVALLKRFPDRFMTGSDPVWPPGSLYRWDVADSGWDRLGQFLDYHRAWLDRLPPDLAGKIRLENAVDFYGFVLETRAGNLRVD